MRLTRRGWGVVGVAAVAFAMGAFFGARALNAVVLPALIALVAGAVQLRALSVPGVERDPPADGFPGETGTVTLRFPTDDPFTGIVRDGVPEGLTARPPAVETTVGAGPVSYDLEYRARGDHVLGPVRLTARDVLGVVERDLAVASRSHLLVYPAVRDLTATAMRDLHSLFDTTRTDERDEFDRLRGYERGDPLRDVHWKSTAKRDDLVVKEFAADSRARAVRVACGATRGGADEMAEAAASVALGLLSAGVPVDLRTPRGEVTGVVGGERTVLEHLARVGSGAVPDDDADVVVRATDGGATVRVAGVERPFEAYVGGGPPGAGDRERPATEEGTGSPPGVDPGEVTA